MSTLWKALQLKHSPFDPFAHPHSFFSSQTQHSTLEQLEKHKKQPTLSLLVGETGLGKTTLAQRYYQHHIQQGLYLSASPQLPLAHLIKKMALAIHTTPPSLMEPHDRQLYQIQQKIAERGVPFKIIIDDADCLPLTTLAALIHLLAHQTHHLFSVLLIGSHHICTSVNDLTMKGEQGIQVNTYSLRPWSKKDIQAYALKRMQQAGWKQELPKLSRAFWDKIYEESEGFPKQVIQILNNKLLSEIITVPHTKTPQSHMPPPWFLASSCLTLMMLTTPSVSSAYVHFSDRLVTQLVTWINHPLHHPSCTSNQCQWASSSLTLSKTRKHQHIRKQKIT